MESNELLVLEVLMTLKELNRICRAGRSVKWSFYGIVSAGKARGIIEKVYKVCRRVPTYQERGNLNIPTNLGTKVLLVIQRLPGVDGVIMTVAKNKESSQEKTWACFHSNPFAKVWEFQPGHVGVVDIGNKVVVQY